MRATPYRLEEEKMAVDPAAGRGHGSRPAFLPRLLGRRALATISIPSPPMTFADGIAAVALGLGRAVVDGGKCLTLLPALSAAPAAVLVGRRHSRELRKPNSGRWNSTALRMARGPGHLREVRFGLDVAEKRWHAARRGLDLFRRQSRRLRRAQPPGRAHRELSRPCSSMDVSLGRDS